MENKQDQILQLLTKREQEVFLTLLKGKTDLEISQKLSVSIYTVKSHIKNIYQKLNVRNRLEAAFLYYEGL